MFIKLRWSESKIALTSNVFPLSSKAFTSKKYPSGCTPTICQRKLSSAAAACGIALT